MKHEIANVEMDHNMENEKSKKVTFVICYIQ